MMNNPVLGTPKKEAAPLLFLFPTRCLMFLSGVLCPLVFIACIGTSNMLVDDAWQDGQFKTKASLLLTLINLIPFLPGILYSIIALGSICIKPDSRRSLLVRIGIYSGGILSTHFCILTMIATDGFVFFLGLGTIVVGGPILYFISYFLESFIKRTNPKRFSIQAIMSFVLVTAVLQSLALLLGNYIFLPFYYLVIGILGTPFYCAVTFILTASRIVYYQKSQTEDTNLMVALFSWLSWFGYYFASWQYALRQMAETYSQLPTSPPSGNCYVSSAAANGHASLVRTFKENQNRKINRQMQDVKVLEFSLQIMAPEIHRQIRKVYNKIGPKLAKWLRQSPILADFAFITLLPFQLAGKIVIWLSGLDIRTVRRMYR